MKFLIGFLVTIGLLIVVFILIFRGVGNKNETTAQQINLVDYATTSKIVQMTEKGPVNANQEHDEVRITVTNMESSIEVFKGYEGNLVKTQTYPNNSQAYADFLRALQLAGYTKGNKDSKVADERGYCATGTRYIFSIKDGDNSIQRLWSSSCNVGSFKGKTSAVEALFQAQIPDYNTVSTL
jgi:hypothetical protein